MTDDIIANPEHAKEQLNELLERYKRDKECISCHRKGVAMIPCTFFYGFGNEMKNYDSYIGFICEECSEKMKSKPNITVSGEKQ